MTAPAKLIDAAKSLSFTQGDEVWKELRSRAENSLYFFNATVLGFADVFELHEDTHIIPTLFMQRTTGIPEIDDAPVQLCMWPRKTGKSSCGTIGRSIWWACKYPNIAILIANEKEETAKDFIKSIKFHFESNALLRALFPEVIPPDFNKVEWSSTRATLHRTTGRPEATFDCIGTGGTKTGKHYDVIIGDDIISKEAMESARSGNWSLMERANRWVNQSTPLLSNAGNFPGFPFRCFIGTCWWIGDTYEHIEKSLGMDQPVKRFRLRVRLSTGKTIHREVTRQGNIAILKMAAMENGVEVFPKIWSIEAIEEMRFSDPELCACNLFNNPSAADIRTFSDDWLRYWRFTNDKADTITYKLEDGKNHYVKVDELIKRAVTDPAFSTSGDSSRAACVVVGTDMETGKHLILEATAKQQDPEDNLEDFLNLIQKWNVRVAYVELAGQQLAYLQWLQREAISRGIPVSLEKVTPGGRRKDARIETLLIPFKQGELYVGHGQSVLIDDEYRHWRPGSRRADVLDALAYAMEVVPKPAFSESGGSAKERSKRQLNSYLRRRGLQTA